MLTHIFVLNANADIWGTKDSFHLFDKQEVTGDVSIEMLVESFESK